MLAVAPEYRGRALGYRLKLAQRERALAKGIKRMTWTFDPLQSRNAHLNFARLGVVSDDYRVDYYGDASTSPLHRFGTDRLWLTWHLVDERVVRRIDATSDDSEQSCDEIVKAMPLVRSTDKGEPEVSSLAEVANVDLISVEIPASIDELQRTHPDLARRWRKATRGAFQSALAAGYAVEEFVRCGRDGRRCGSYLLRRKHGETELERREDEDRRD
jgi:predicted GNAT superfamily acetyltransferase